MMNSNITRDIRNETVEMVRPAPDALSSAYRNDTIVSLATPPGISGVAVIRLSGPDALTFAESICDKSLSTKPRQAILSTLHYNNASEHVDTAIVTYFEHPNSFTGEHVVEFSTHGGLVTANLVVQSLLEAGARQSEPGEFTMRAFLNGKIDLTEAESIHDQIVALSQRAQGVAVGNVSGHLSHQLRSIRDNLIRLMTILEHELDFSEDEIDSMTSDSITTHIGDAMAQLTRLQNTAPFGRMLREGARVVLAGPPNAGKSSLFNALIGREQAIVTSIPGTTRDALEAWIDFDGFPVCLIDTAGLREGGDPIERVGIEKSRAALNAADVILALDPVDPHLFELGPIRDGVSIVFIRSKVDAASNKANDNTIEISIKRTDGLDSLHEAIVASLHTRIPRGDSAIITSNRQRLGVDRALERLTTAQTAYLSGQSIDLLAADIRLASNFLSELIGETTDEEVIEQIFQNFCIGK